MEFTDIHNHSLFASDDGAKTKEEMFEMVDASYNDGVRYMCFSPHYNPGYFGYNKGKSQSAFEILQEYVNKKYKDLKIAIGNELRYNEGCNSWIEEGKCRTMNNTKYVLVDFSDNVAVKDICSAVDSLAQSGYIAIVAHVERYVNLRGNLDFYYKYRARGAFIQIDTRSLFKDFGLGAYHTAKKLLSKNLVDIVSSDAHNMKSRPPGLSLAYDFISRKYGESYAKKICFENAKNLIF